MRGVILLFIIKNVYLVSVPLPGTELLGGECDVLGEGHGSSESFPHTSLSAYLPFGCSYIVSFCNKLVFE